ncbi:MAG: DUF370 domain-containing protein [Clostridia bacterium]|nr:DUF370 domain-containing protein [Clostridia bacterium]
MFIHLGQEWIVNEKDVIGIFDIENTTISKNTRQFLAKSEKRKEVTTVSYELPKSFIVCSDKKNKNKVFISQISSSTLEKRTKSKDIV